MSLLKRFWLNENGAVAIEYVMIGGLVSILIIGGTMTMGQKMADNFSTFGAAFGTAP